jgi:adipocyte-derived leucine aminopeptidase
LASTQFEDSYARRAFPCFDEPAMKATFKWTLIRHRSFETSFFNTPVIRTETNGEWLTDYFEETVKMSTYLVAFVISSFKQITRTSQNGIQVEVAAKPESIEAGEGDFALDEATQIIDFFVDYLTVQYPLKKSSKQHL